MDERYQRQMLFKNWGVPGQEKLRQSRVLVIGCGALGSCAASLLARAGVGHLTIVDRDFPDLGNLHRQILYDERDVAAGLPKALAAQRHLREINSEVNVEARVLDVNAKNIEALTLDVDLIIDGLDNFETRFLLNEACVKNKKNWIYAAVIQSYGVSLPIIPHYTSCLTCVIEQLPAPGTMPTCETAGVIGSAPVALAAWQTTQALRLLIEGAEHYSPRLFSIDLWQQTASLLPVARRADCPVCAKGEFRLLTEKRGSRCEMFCGKQAWQITPAESAVLNLEELARGFAADKIKTANAYLLRLELDGCEVALFTDGRAIITGARDEAHARSIYAANFGA